MIKTIKKQKIDKIRFEVLQLILEHTNYIIKKNKQNNVDGFVDFLRFLQKIPINFKDPLLMKNMIENSMDVFKKFESVQYESKQLIFKEVEQKLNEFVEEKLSENLFNWLQLKINELRKIKETLNLEGEENG